MQDCLRKKHPDYRKNPSRKYYWDALDREMLSESLLLHAPIAKFGYAATGHKAQGGEWDEVWVDYRSGNTHCRDFFKWAYTATTRAKRHLHVLGNVKLDALADVFNSTETPSQKPPADRIDKSNCESVQSLKELLAGFGFALVATKDLSYRKRILVKCDGKPDLTGHIDIVFNRKNVVSSVEVKCSCDLPQALIEELDRMNGFDIRAVMGEKVSIGKHDLERLGRPAQVEIARRFFNAVEHSGLVVRNVERSTPYHVKFRMDKGEVNFYFDGNDRLTNMNHNLDEHIFSRIKQLI